MLKIERSVIWKNRDGNSMSYFIPRTTLYRDCHSSGLMMTLQGITGSDYFHPVQESYSFDLGKNWSDPVKIPALGRNAVTGDIEEGVCDVLPEYHPQTETVLAIGHNVYYREGRLFDSLGDFHNENGGKRLQRFPAYVIRDKNGNWSSERSKISHSEFEECSIYTCGSSQRVILPDGSLIIPVTFGFWGRKDRMVRSLKCSYDGQQVDVESCGNILELSVGRGLLEPSIVFYNNTYYMTMRAEDEHGHVTSSKDGLNWKTFKDWCWDDGEPLTMSTTQQHWLELDKKLYLVYTRKAEENINVTRWRAPLYMAEVDVENLCLKRSSEQTVFPLIGDGINTPKEVALMGNFHPLKLTEKSAIITVGEMIPFKGFTGNTLQAMVYS